MDSRFQKTADLNRTEFEFFKKKIFPIVMKWEGGGKLHTVAGDTGGQTIWGIAYNKNRGAFSGLKDHADTTETEAASFAFVEYYLPLKPQFLPCETKIYAFDIAYNMGVGKAKIYIQQCIGVSADGIFGPQTEKAMSKLKLDCLHKLRVAFYNNLGSKPTYAKFFKGWMNRANDIYKQSKL